jgi:poly-D-alanine transfer protein DltD
VNLGGNNIQASCNPTSIFEDIKNIVEELKENGVEKVFVSAIIERGKFPSWTGMNQTSFNKIRKSVNEKLKKYLKEDYVDTAKRLRYPRHYNSDQVHPGFSEGGMEILRSTIHRCFSKTLK